jgi:ABC-type glutathione transport system ATPase component
MMPVAVPGPGSTVLEAVNVGRAFGSRRTSVVAVDGVDMRLSDHGTCTGIVGESGSGKSTLARMLAGLLPPSSGSITFNGKELRDVLSSRGGVTEYRRAVQFVGQDTTSSFDPRRTLRDSVRLPAQRLLGLGRASADEQVDRVIDALGLPPGYAERRPHQVSGGQRQRFALARGLIVQPRVLICDEVVSALDVSVQGAILNGLKRFCRSSGAAIAFVSHGIPATAFVSDDIAVMLAGRIVERGPTASIVDHAGHQYTRSLIAAHRRAG